MELNSRLTRLEQQAGTAGCPECGSGGGRITLLPIAFDADGRQAEYDPPSPCPLCGAEPVRLFPMKLDGDVCLKDEVQ